MVFRLKKLLLESFSFFHNVEYLKEKVDNFIFIDTRR
jgi:hypothetical protein